MITGGLSRRRRAANWRPCSVVNTRVLLLGNETKKNQGLLGHAPWLPATSSVQKKKHTNLDIEYVQIHSSLRLGFLGL